MATGGENRRPPAGRTDGRLRGDPHGRRQTMYPPRGKVVALPGTAYLVPHAKVRRDPVAHRRHVLGEQHPLRITVLLDGSALSSTTSRRGSSIGTSSRSSSICRRSEIAARAVDTAAVRSRRRLRTAFRGHPAPTCPWARSGSCAAERRRCSRYARPASPGFCSIVRARRTSALEQWPDHAAPARPGAAAELSGRGNRSDPRSRPVPAAQSGGRFGRCPT
jgi:hypothetical protein